MLNYSQVLELLINKGFLTHQAELKYPGIIIEFGSHILKQFGLLIAENSSLLVSKEEGQFVFYEKNNGNTIGDGDEGWIWAGVNIRTGDKVAIKSQYLLFENITQAYAKLPEGWLLAKQRLNQYPYFAKTYTSGFVYEIHDTNLTALPVEHRAWRHFVQVNQIMERIIVGFNLHRSGDFKLWSGAQILQVIMDGLNAYEAMYREKIVGFDPYTSNYLIDSQGRLKLCDFNPLTLLADDDNSSKPAFRNALNLLSRLYGEYIYPINNTPKILAAAKIISDTISHFRDNYPLPKEELIKKLGMIIIELERQKCIIQCEDENDFAINVIKETNARQMGMSPEEFCPMLCHSVDLDNTQTIREKIAHFIVPQTKVNWRSVTSNVFQSAALTFSTELIKDGLKYCSTPRWLYEVVDHAIKDSWMWSQGSAYSAVTTSIATELCGVVGLSNNAKAAIGITTGLMTNVVFQYPSATLATSVVTGVASFFASTISFWGEKKLAKRIGILSDVDRVTVFKSQQQSDTSVTLSRHEINNVKVQHFKAG